MLVRRFWIEFRILKFWILNMWFELLVMVFNLVLDMELLILIVIIFILEVFKVLVCMLKSSVWFESFNNY